MNAGTGTVPSTLDPAAGAWVQKGNASFTMILSPNGNALLRFKMPPESSIMGYTNVTGTWVRTGSDRIGVTYVGPLTGEVRTLYIVFEDSNQGYVDTVINGNGTIISPMNRTRQDKLSLVRAGSGAGYDNLAPMEIAKS
jgi:hypothetical protein